jgi:hypothetical protein
MLSARGAEKNRINARASARNRAGKYIGIAQIGQFITILAIQRMNRARADNCGNAIAGQLWQCHCNRPNVTTYFVAILIAMIFSHTFNSE